MNTGWKLLQEVCEEKIRVRVFQVKETELQLACTRACVAVYADHGASHPATFGAADSVQNMESKLKQLRGEQREWQECWELVTGQMKEDAPVIVPRELQRTPK